METHISHWQWFLFCPRAAKLLFLLYNTIDNSLQSQTLIFSALYESEVVCIQTAIDGSRSSANEWGVQV